MGGSRTQRAPTTVQAIALLVGGAYGSAMVVFGLYTVAGASFPLAFGIDLSGDRQYPFPYPEGALLGLLVGACGLGLCALLVAAVKQRPGARDAAVAALGAVVVVAAVVAVTTRGSRRCAFETYSSTDHCMSATASTLRDFAILATPAFVAIGCLIWGKHADSAET